jgi:tryptophan-rich sensory protein
MDSEIIILNITTNIINTISSIIELTGLIGLLILLVLYFLPFVVAIFRHHRNKGAIFILNLFLGWTLVGWVVAVMWAVLSDQKVRS